jgi:hypothetical protein
LAVPAERTALFRFTHPTIVGKHKSRFRRCQGRLERVKMRRWRQAVEAEKGYASLTLLLRKISRQLGLRLTILRWDEQISGYDNAVFGSFMVSFGKYDFEQRRRFSVIFLPYRTNMGKPASCFKVLSFFVPFR